MIKIFLHPDNREFWNFCREKKLIFQKCTNCGKIRWPYSFCCPECYSSDYHLSESKGLGRIYSYVIYNVPFHKDFKDRVPYIVGVIELDEGVKFLSNIVAKNFENIHCGEKVKLFWEKLNDFYIPKFCLN